MPPTITVVFAQFVLSGFCALLYEIVWMRLALSSFGVITPIISIVVSVFMLGLALGSWLSGRFASGLSRRTGLSPMILYAGAELLIAVSAVAVPATFRICATSLSSLGQADSFGYLTFSALSIGLAILPWATVMGMTFPLMLAFIRERGAAGVETKAFSFLYIANVIGAALGAYITTFMLIELNGFHGTLLVAQKLNILIAMLAMWLASRHGYRASVTETQPATPSVKSTLVGLPANDRKALWILFFTGFCSMGMEVTWTRAFSGNLGGTVYAFAMILVIYLLATFAGSVAYRSAFRAKRGLNTDFLLATAIAAALLPIILNDLRLGLGIYGLLGGLVPFCALLGYLTPQVIDGFSGGDPRKAGLAQSVNTIGCILGPLVASYALLPFMVERYALLALATPMFVFTMKRRNAPIHAISAALALVCVFWAALGTEGPPPYLRKIIRTDHTASVVALQSETQKSLLVNGIGMTRQTVITKMMSHMPIAFHAGPVRSVLVICFGMGTTFRSALSWGVPTTAVELVPSVPRMFGFFYDDSAEVLKKEGARIIIDDGRRYLKRTTEKFDVVTIDPPPPIDSAGSGMLYSTEFYSELSQRLNPGAVVQIWYPGRVPAMIRAVTRSVSKTFPNVRAFVSVEGWGVHLLASKEPVPPISSAALKAKFPASARTDLLEWSDKSSDGFNRLVERFASNEIRNFKSVLEGGTEEITDDEPYNEYYRMRALNGAQVEH